jgi:hypothetical protein
MASIAIDRLDGLSSSAAIKGPVKAATTANITLSGEQTIDGVAIVDGDRVLVKDQTTGSENGVYVADTGPWRRAKDFNRTRDVVEGTIIYVTDGTVSGGKSFSITTANPISVGTTSIVFERVFATATEGGLANNSFQKTTGDDVFGTSVNTARIYGRTRDVVSILDYATSSAARTALQNGSTSPLTMWDDAMSDIASDGPKILLLPEGDYSLDTDEELANTAGAIIRGMTGNTVIRKSGAGSLFTTPNARPDTATGVALAANAVAGAMSVTLTAGGGVSFQEQATCILISEAAIRTGNAAKTGEFVKIQDITGDVVTFWSPLEHSYLTANTAKLMNVTLQEGVAFENLVIEMDPTATVNNSNSFQEMFALDLRWLLNPRIDNITIKDAVHAGVCLHGCVDAKISNLTGLYFGSATTGSADPTASDGTPGYGYGIREDGLNVGLLASGLLFDACRHGYTSIAGYTSADRLNYGWNTGSVISNGIHRNARNMGWDTHWAGSRTMFANLQTVGGRYGGFQVRSEGLHMVDCMASDCVGPALWIRGGGGSDPNARGDGASISSIRAIRTNLGTTYDDGIDWRERAAIMDEAYDTDIDDYSVYYTGGPALQIGRNGVGKRNMATGGKATNPCQLTTTKPYAISIEATNADADISIDGFRLNSDDGKVVNILRRSSNGARVDVNNVRGRGHTGAALFVDDDDTLLTVTTPSEVRYLDQISKPRLFDDFLGNTLRPEWRGAAGSDAQAVAPAIFSSLNGECRLVTGDDAGATMALNGSQLSSVTQWRAQDGGLSIEISIQLSAITNVAVFVGLTDQVSALEMPFTLAAGDALTSNATDAVGVLFDTAADTDNWWFVGVKADVDATKENSGYAPVAGAFPPERWRIDIDTSGAATFFRNGSKKGTKMNNAVSNNVLLTPVVAAFSRGAASRNIDVGHIFIEQNRGS